MLYSPLLMPWKEQNKCSSDSIQTILSSYKATDLNPIETLYRFNVYKTSIRRQDVGDVV